MSKEETAKERSSRRLSETEGNKKEDEDKIMWKEKMMAKAKLLRETKSGIASKDFKRAK